MLYICKPQNRQNNVQKKDTILSPESVDLEDLSDGVMVMSKLTTRSWEQISCIDHNHAAVRMPTSDKGLHNPC